MQDNKHDEFPFESARIFDHGHYLFLEANRFFKLRSRKTVHFSEQPIMSANKFFNSNGAIVNLFNKYIRKVTSQYYIGRDLGSQSLVDSYI